MITRNFWIILFLLIPATSLAQLCFTTMNPVNVSEANSRQLCKADFNNDGKIDFVCPNANGKMSVILGDGNGGILSVWNDSITDFAGNACTADFNNDTNMDVAIYNYGSGIGFIAFGDGTGHFSVNTLSFGAIYTPSACLCADDFNNDGKVDLALSSGFNSVVINFGTGGGTFGLPVNITTTTAIIGELVSSDFNNDGNKDLACLNTVLLGDGVGGFTSSYTFNPINHPRSLVADDFNNDGKQDIATANSGIGASTGFVGSATLYIGDGAGGFTASSDFSLGDSVIPFQDRYQICSGDFDGDTKLDIAISTMNKKVSLNTSQATILTGNGSGGFNSAVQFQVPNYPHAIVSHDINNDGRTDLGLLNRGIADSLKLTILVSCNVEEVSNAMEATTKVQIYPNPSTGNIVIQSQLLMEDIRIFDMMGNAIYNTQPHQSSHQLFIQTPGIYFLQIKTSNGIVNKKVVIE